MQHRSIAGLRLLAIASVASLAWSGLAGAQSFPRAKPRPPIKDATFAAVATPAVASASSSRWQLLTNQPPVLNYTECGPGNPLLLTDGTVMLADDGCQDWWKLTPDEYGSYVNGTWTEIASTPAGYAPLYHSSAVLPDGRVIIMGGEYNFGVAVWTNLGAIYDPRANTWTPVNAPEDWTTIGDSQGVVLFDGTFMQANCCTTQAALLDAKTLTWTATGRGKYDPNDEEGWTLLPNGKVLTVDAYVPLSPFVVPTPVQGDTNSEIYNPFTGAWRSAGSTKVQLWDSASEPAPGCGGLSDASSEVGPAVLRADGTVFYMGSNSCGPGNTAIYDSYTGTWTPGPTFPGSLDIADGPASIEPNGKVLMMASPGIFGTPSTFLEWDGRTLTEIAPAPNASIDSSYYGNFLALPTGQILFTDFYDVSVYNPSGTYNEEWAPQVWKAPEAVRPGGTYIVEGYLFNGVSQGASYGDDVQGATNYPLVRITNNATHHVFYSRTHGHSSMGVGFFVGPVSTNFDVPATQERGPSELVVVTNGIPSTPVAVYVE
jgi:hypothetical protein